MFIPISFICIFPYEALRWTLVAVATVTSGLFIMLNLRHPVFEHAGAKCAPLVIPYGGQRQVMDRVRSCVPSQQVALKHTPHAPLL